MSNWSRYYYGMSLREITGVGRVPRLSGNNQQFQSPPYLKTIQTQVYFWEHGKIRIGKLKFHPGFGTGVETDLQF
jgi:hypothetical protein